MSDGYILQMNNITKTFPGVKALSDVTLNVSEASIHAICGENGAGKSTLMKVLSGVYPYGSYDGEIVFQGKKMTFKNIKDSERAGIVIIHQELTMIPELSVTENIFMGNEIVEKGLINWEKERKITRELLEKVGLHIDPNTIIKNLGVGQQQLVEIAKALSKNVKVLILDEPTANFDPEFRKQFLHMITSFIKNGDCSVILATHQLQELDQIADYITLIHCGKLVFSMEKEMDYDMAERILQEEFEKIRSAELEIGAWNGEKYEENRKKVEEVTMDIVKAQS